MSPDRSTSAPLPVTLLALSVAVCLTSAAHAGPMAPTTLSGGNAPSRATVADQRDAFEHLLAALHDAAKKLGERLDQQAADLHSFNQSNHSTPAAVATCLDQTAARPTALRDELLSLPPPAAR